MIRVLFFTGLSALFFDDALCQNTVEMTKEDLKGNPSSLMKRLRENILTYDNVYFAWNRRHLEDDTSSLWEIEGKKDEEFMQSLKKQRDETRPVTGLKMKVTDVPDKVESLEDFSSEGRERRAATGPSRPLRMILSEAAHLDSHFEDFAAQDESAREKRWVGRPGTRPLRMILSDNIVDDDERASIEKRSAAAPLRMILSDGSHIDAQFEEFDISSAREKRSLSRPTRPLRMILSDNIVDDEKASIEKRSAAGPLRMILSDGSHIDAQFEEFDVSSAREKRNVHRPGPRPLRMIISADIVDDEENAHIEKRSVEKRAVTGLKMKVDDVPEMKVSLTDFTAETREKRNVHRPRPLRMIISENIVDDDEKVSIKKRSAAAPLRMILSDGSHIDTQFEEFDVINTREKRNVHRSRPLRMIISDNIVDDDEKVSIKKRSAAAPLRMILSDGSHIDAQFEEFDVSSSKQKRSVNQPRPPRPLRMIISENIVDIDEQSHVEKRSAKKKRAVTGLKMKIDDVPEKVASVAEFVSEKEDREKRNAVLLDSESDLSEGESLVRNRKEAGRPGTQPLRMIISDSVADVEGTDKKKTDTLNADQNKFHWSKEYTDQSAKEAALIQEWFEAAGSLVKFIPDSHIYLFENWQTVIQLFADDPELRRQFTQLFPAMIVRDAVEVVSVDAVFQQLFWPFVYRIGFLNQKLSLLGFNGQEVSKSQQKLAFYEALEQYQDIKIKPAADNVTYSFNDYDIVDGLNRSGLVEFSKDFVEAGRHLATEEEKSKMISKVSAAMKLIEERTPELYKAINQLVGTFAFYKAEQPGYIGGTVSSALGIIWLDPGAMKDLSVPFFAEQIVHEYIHTALFYAELVHGTYTDHANLPNAKVVSSIRKQLRDYDKSFHAAYVSTGLVAFHSRAGFWNRAESLAESLLPTVDDLILVDRRTNILNDSGKAMLQAMVDFLTVTRLIY